MKNVQRSRESLLSYLSEKGIQFSQVSKDELKGEEEFILSIEADASANGIRILKETGVDFEDVTEQ